MSDVKQGKLRWIAEKSKPRVFRLAWTAKSGKPQPELSPGPDILAQDMKDATDNDIAVDYELNAQGRPINIRRAGAPWVAPSPSAAAPQRGPDRGRPGGGRGNASTSSNQGRRNDAPMPAREGHFHNPYNFVPAVEPTRTGDLAARAPVGHKAWYPDHFSGRITVDIEVKTPLLVPDASRATKLDNGHVILPLLTEPDGTTPRLPPTSFKGALRAAYEAITNSRLSVFQGHDVPLGRRMDAREGLAMVPARIGEDEKLELWMGTLNPTNDAEYRRNCPQNGRPPGNVMYAAWLPQYFRKGRSRSGPAYDRNALRYPDGSVPHHGQPVVCWLRKYQKISRSGGPAFSYWRVEAIAKGHDFAALSKVAPDPDTRPSQYHEAVPNETPIRGWGYVSITNQNIGSKHDERVFFVREHAKPYRLDVAPDDLKRWRNDWRHLVADYKDKAAKIIERRRAKGIELDTYEGSDIGQTALSRHICDDAAAEIHNGDLCFARIQNGITGLFPVMISREVAKVTPAQLLLDELAPATSIADLSPADRVFGWVDQSGGAGRQGEKRAYKGQLRIAALRYRECRDENGASTSPITTFEHPGLPLAILSTPKPEQARFYVAGDKIGAPQRAGLSKEQAAYGNAAVKGLRGRKVYPHHRDLPDGYWDGPNALRTAHDRPDQAQSVGERFREYIRTARDATSPGNADRNRAALRDDQNRSIGGWVNPGVRFQAEIDVINLTKVELGALLWLLSLREDHYLRLGGGKPLGFGSVRVSIASLNVEEGKAIRQRLLSILPQPPSIGATSDQVRTDAVQAYEDAMLEAYGNGARKLDEVRIVKAFLNAAQGFAGKPIHYPRASKEPRPEGKNFEWFVANESTDGHKQSLDALWSPTGL